MLLLLIACASDLPDSSSTSGTPEDTGPTYWKDAKAVLDANCVRCHTEHGVATSFDDPATVQALAPTIAAYTAEGRMPLPAPDPDCRAYQDSDRYTLTAEEQAVLQAWADAGAPLGDEADAPPPVVPTTLAPFDIELRATEAYTPDFRDDGLNDYRCFLLDVGNDESLYLTGVEPLVDNGTIVHHVVLFEVDSNEVPSSPDPHLGFSCDGFGENGWDFVTGWAPGGGPVQLPDGYGIKLKKDAQLVLQMHYFNSYEGASTEIDQSGYGLITAEEVENRVYVYPLGAYDFTIPAGDADYEIPMMIPWPSTYPAIEILGVFPHMHQLGSGFDMYVAHADGSQTCLADLDGWDFHNQISALFDESAQVASGDALFLSCQYDNSAGNPNQFNNPPQDVEWGEGTEEEMCFGFTYGAQL
jgi:hypothetical protein